LHAETPSRAAPVVCAGPASTRSIGLRFRPGLSAGRSSSWARARRRLSPTFGPIRASASATTPCEARGEVRFAGSSAHPGTLSFLSFPASPSPW